MRQSRRRKSRQQKQPEDNFEEKLKIDFGDFDNRKKEKKNWYVSFCRKAGKMFKAPNSFKDPNYKKALDFLNWDLQPKEVNAAPTLALMIGFIIALPVFLYLLYASFITYSLPSMFLIYIGLPILIVPFMLSAFIQKYPFSAVNLIKMQSVTYIPEIINYMVMSMKLSPNLEKAVDFAAEHGKGKIADDLKEVSWKAKMGGYKSIEEALDEIAYKWGEESDVFKHALMIIRSSVIEVDDAKREVLLDKAASDTLSGMQEDMNKYVSQMKQPSIYLYYVGVLLPLLLIIMLPIGAAMAGMAISKTIYLILMYDIGIPLITILFAKNILAKRPPIYTPPKIPDDYPGLPKKGYVKLGKSTLPIWLVSGVFAVIVFAVFAYGLEPLLNPMPPSWNTAAVQNYFHFFSIAGAFMAVITFFSLYVYFGTKTKRRVQLEIVKMEKEFQDSLYLLASRLGENRPMEEALTYTADFMKGKKVASLFEKTADNINNLGMTVEGALFDPVYGSLKNIPSTLIKGSFRLIVDSMKLGVQQAARALISLSLQLRDSQKIKEKIRVMLEEITSMMKSIAFFIGPLVLGITTALQKIIINAISASCNQSTELVSSGTNVQMMTLCKSPEALKSIPSAKVFLIIMAIYVIEVTVILLFFTSKIEEGDNELSVKMSIAKTLPIALLLFFLSAFFAAMMNVTG